MRPPLCAGGGAIKNPPVFLSGLLTVRWASPFWCPPPSLSGNYTVVDVSLLLTVSGNFTGFQLIINAPCFLTRGPGSQAPPPSLFHKFTRVNSSRRETYNFAHAAETGVSRPQHSARLYLFSVQGCPSQNDCGRKKMKNCVPPVQD